MGWGRDFFEGMKSSRLMSFVGGDGVFDFGLGGLIRFFF